MVWESIELRKQLLTMFLLWADSVIILGERFMNIVKGIAWITARIDEHELI